MTREQHPSFAEWERTLALAITGDPLWSVQAYRISVYAIDCHTFDRRSTEGFSQATSFDQLTRALGSIAANISEGYSRSSAADRSRFYSYAVGSTREAIAWYSTMRVDLGTTVDERLSTLMQIRRLLLATLRRSRPKDPSSMLRDPGPID